MAANSIEFLSGVMKNILKLIMMMVAQHCEYSKSH